MARILITTSTFDLENFRDRATVEASGYEIVLNPRGRRLTEAEVAGLLKEGVVGMVAGVEPLTRPVLEGATSLKVIARCGSGMDNVDLDAAQSLGITVNSTPDAPAGAVAELTVAHILSLARRIAESDRAIRGARWQPLMGSLIASQTIGIVGFGRIGRKVARLLSAFETRLLACDVSPMRDAPGSPDFTSLPALLAQSDIVTLHVPYLPATHHLIDAAAIAGMKKGALLVNVARGGLVDEPALREALLSGHIGGAAFDCFEQEPYAGPLLDCESFQASAHMGSYARETRSIMETEACAALVAGLRQHSLL